MLYERVYSAFIEAIDAMDNGGDWLCSTHCLRRTDVTGYPECVTDTYRMRKACKTYSDCTGLTARVRRMNVHWRSPPDVTPDGQFQKAMELCGKEFTEFVLYRAHVRPFFWLRHLTTMRRLEVHSGTKIRGTCPAKHLRCQRSRRYYGVGDRVSVEQIPPRTRIPDLKSQPSQVLYLYGRK